MEQSTEAQAAPSSLWGWVIPALAVAVGANLLAWWLRQRAAGLLPVALPASTEVLLRAAFAVATPPGQAIGLVVAAGLVQPAREPADRRRHLLVLALLLASLGAFAWTATELAVTGLSPAPARMWVGVLGLIGVLVLGLELLLRLVVHARRVARAPRAGAGEEALRALSLAILPALAAVPLIGALLPEHDPSGLLWTGLRIAGVGSACGVCWGAALLWRLRRSTGDEVGPPAG